MEFVVFALEGPGVSWLNLWLCVCVCFFQVNAAIGWWSGLGVILFERRQDSIIFV